MSEPHCPTREPRPALTVAAPRPPTGASALRDASDTITHLFMDATTLSYGLDGLQAMAADGSRPALAWPDALEPLRQLAGAVAMLAQELYLAVDPDVASRAQEADRRWALSALAEEREFRRVEASAERRTR